MHNKDNNGFLEADNFCAFLDKITSFIWAYTIQKYTQQLHLLREQANHDIYACIVGIQQ